MECGDDVPSSLSSEMTEDGARLFEFWVRDESGTKLDPAHIRALLYALGTGLGLTSPRFPLTPPNRDVEMSG